MRVHIRGNHKNLGEVAPRRFLQIVAGEKQAAVSEGSGRLQLAEWMVRPENPLTARVMVNRLWKHHFGQGIVRSVDNFGKTGDAADPSRTARFPGAAVYREWLVSEGTAPNDGAEQYLRHVQPASA